MSWIRFFGGGFTKNRYIYIYGGLLKKGLGQFANWRGGGLGKKKGVVFLSGWGGGADTRIHTMGTYLSVTFEL